jgi:hypothetical protein
MIFSLPRSKMNVYLTRQRKRTKTGDKIMRGFPYSDSYLLGGKPLDKVAVLYRYGPDRVVPVDGDHRVKIDTGAREDGRTILLVQETELAPHHVEHLDLASGDVGLRFDGEDYVFHRSDAHTKQLVFWPLGFPLADVQEGQEHIESFENEGGPAHPAAIGEGDGVVVSPRFPVSGPAVRRVNPNEDGGVNWPIATDRPSGTQ